MPINDRYEIRLPLLCDFPGFMEMATEPRKLAQELVKVSVYENGILVGDAIPLDEAMPIIRAIIDKLFPTEKNE
jgi:hypothetical protein